MANHYISILIACFSLSAFCLNAQSGVITGRVIESGSQSPLPGANVYIKSSITTGTVTDIDGQFILNGIDVGPQVVVASFLGYELQERSVEVSENGKVEVNFELSPNAVMGKEVLVTAQALGQAKAINQQLNSESIVNIVSSDRIQELPDVNAAEAIARLPGVAIDRNGGEGQKIVIRGMEPKFAAISVNGVRLPSNSGTDRSVDLSMISPEMLDGIEVFKSPLPDMDAESVAGAVNLRLRRAPEEWKFLVRVLGGYNDLNSDWGDYKGILQVSKRIFNDKLGFVAQGSIERFNRGGDRLSYNWSQGGTDANTGITTIRGSSLSLQDVSEKRRRLNGSLNLDYEMGKHRFGLFGLYSRTERDRFIMQNSYNPNAPGISYRGTSIDNSIDLFTVSLNGEHPFGKVLVDWGLATSRTEQQVPYNFYMDFSDNTIPFDSELDPNGHPRDFLDAANPDFNNAFLNRNEFETSNTLEETNTALLNFKIPFKLSEGIGGYFKAGGKYFTADRDRVVNLESENFYYLGGEFTRTAREQFKGDLISSQLNGQLISIQNFLANAPAIDFENEDGNSLDFDASLNPDLVRDWYAAQQSLLNNNRFALVDNYQVSESILAGYAMFKLDFGKTLTVIPGFRFERSDNDYSAGISTVNGRYGVNGIIIDTTTVQQYNEFLPNLHLKFKPLEWFDIRASYANTLARPDYAFLTPRAQINNTSLAIQAGNPNLNYARSTNYDLFLSAYKGGLGLISIGGFYKDVENIFTDRTTFLADPEIAAENGWPNNSGYELTSYVNLPESRVWGFEIDLQSNLNFLPKPLNGLVLNVNYARLYSETQVFFLTSETVLIIPVPPVFETTFTSNIRDVAMPSQAPDVFRMSVGYDLKGFSARVSGSYQGTKARSYSLNKDFDSFDLDFWRWDASLKQKVGDHWSLFLNINNFSNQQDIRFIRNENFLNRIETFGMTGTFGLQYKL